MKVTSDWGVRESVCVMIRILVKRILRRYSYPPNQEAHATELALEQAEIVCPDQAAMA